MISQFRFLRIEDEQGEDYSNQRIILKEIAYQIKRIADNERLK